MCGIAGIYDLNGRTVAGLDSELAAMSHLIRHRGPDGEGSWRDPRTRRLRPPPPRDHRPRHRRPADDRRAPATGSPTTARSTTTSSCARSWASGNFRTTSDTEVILRAYRALGRRLRRPPARHVRLRALGRGATGRSSAPATASASSRFYYAVVDGELLLRLRGQGAPAVPAGRSRPTSRPSGLPDLPVLPGRQDAVPGHPRAAARPSPARPRTGTIEISRYWDVYYELDFEHTAAYFEEELARAGWRTRCGVHLRADVPVGAYLSGGLDSSIVASLARGRAPGGLGGVQRQVLARPGLRRERVRARRWPSHEGFALHELDITVGDFVDHIRQVIYHLDYPVAGPGSFPQFMVSELARTPPQGRARRAGRRRDLRRLRPLPDRLLRAVHQGGDRRHDARRQLRRHLRVDHPNLRPLRRVQADAPGVLARGPVRATRPALLPPHQPRADLGDEIRWDMPRRLLAVRDLPLDLPRPTTSRGVVLRPR